MPSIPIATHRVTISESELNDVLRVLNQSEHSSESLESFKKKLTILSLKINAGIASPAYVKSNIDRKSVSLDKLGFLTSDSQLELASQTVEPTEDDFSAAERELEEFAKSLESSHSSPSSESL